MPSTQHTPPGEFSVMGDFEEDRKPNIEYLDSLNEYNKRSRSVEDEGELERKQPRVGDGWGQQGAQENGEHLMTNYPCICITALYKYLRPIYFSTG